RICHEDSSSCLYRIARRPRPCRGHAGPGRRQDRRSVHEEQSQGRVRAGVGDTVKWTNPGLITHTVTFDPAQAATAANVALPAGVAPFGSENMEEDATFSHTFTVKGTYKYICKMHEAM